MTKFKGDLKLGFHLSDDPEMILFERLEHLKQYLSFTMQILREDANLTQTELASLLGVKQAAVSKLENPDKQHDFESVMRYLHAVGAELTVGVKAGEKFYQVSDPVDTVIVDIPSATCQDAHAGDQDVRDFVHQVLDCYKVSTQNLFEDLHHIQDCAQDWVAA